MKGMRACEEWWFSWVDILKANRTLRVTRWLGTFANGGWLCESLEDRPTMRALLVVQPNVLNEQWKAHTSKNVRLFLFQLQKKPSQFFPGGASSFWKSTSKKLQTNVEETANYLLCECQAIKSIRLRGETTHSTYLLPEEVIEKPRMIEPGMELMGC